MDDDAQPAAARLFTFYTTTYHLHLFPILPTYYTYLYSTTSYYLYSCRRCSSWASSLCTRTISFAHSFCRISFLWWCIPFTYVAWCRVGSDGGSHLEMMKWCWWKKKCRVVMGVVCIYVCDSVVYWCILPPSSTMLPRPTWQQPIMAKKKWCRSIILM